MFCKTQANKISQVFTIKFRKELIILFWILSFGSDIFAELSLESVYPTLGILEHNLEVRLKGTGFDKNTRVSMSLDVGNTNKIIGSVVTQGNAYRVSVKDEMAYLANGEKGLCIIDVSNPEIPIIIKSVTTPGIARGVAVSGGKAYVADEKCGLQIIDVRNPENSKIIGSLDTPGLAYGVAVSGETAYVADGESGIQVTDIRNPESPEITTTVNISGFAYNVIISDNKAYVASGLNGLAVIDISNMKVIGVADTKGNAYDLAVSDDKAYIADDESARLIITDISNPYAPEIIGSIYTAHNCKGIAVSDQKAYTGDGYGGLRVTDVSNPQNPVFFTAVDTPGAAHGVTIADEKAYVADYQGRLQIIDISNLTSSQIIGVADTPGSAKDLSISDGKAYVAGGLGLYVIDINDSSYPQIIGFAYTKSFANSITVSNDKAYVGCGMGWGGLQIFNISNPVSPMLIATLELPGKPQSMFFSDNKLYIAAKDGGLQVVDVADPEQPVIIGSVDTPGTAYGIAISEGKAYLGDSGSFIIIDISNPKNPEPVGSVITPGSAGDVIISDGKAYVTDWGKGLQIIDIRNPEHPEITGSADTPGLAQDIVVSGDRAYLACGGEGGIQIIDISNPENPKIIGALNTPANAHNLVISDDKAYVADRNSGLVILPLPVVADSVTVNSETVISLTLPSPQIAGHYTLRVFNENESRKYAGSVTFISSENSSILETKAIIVAGRKSHDDDLWKDTRVCANFAYQTLLYQGYTRENICYLSPENTDADSDGLLNDVDGYATKENLRHAIETWAKAPDAPENPAYELLVYITDHGGDKRFTLNENEYLEAETLNKWLNDLQTVMPGRLILIYDACRSGTFLDPLGKYTPGKQRIVITSASDEDALFAKLGEVSGLSFSFQFWSALRNGSELDNAFFFARDMMEDFQTALLDADGNGIGNEYNDRKLANGIAIRRGYKSFSDMPFIENVSISQTLNGENTATFLTEIEAGSFSKAWAVITPPCFNPGTSDIPITNLPTVELQDIDQDGIFKGFYNGFTMNGTYRVNIYATDARGVCSLPRQAVVIQNMGALCPKGDISGDISVDLADAITNLKFAAGIPDSVRPDYITSGTDVNGDNKIGLEEAVYILQNVAGLRE